MEKQATVNLESISKNILFFGRTGHGKSTTCNTLFKYLNRIDLSSTLDEHNPFAVSDMPESCTAEITAREVGGFQIIDGPGFSDTSTFTDCELEMLYKDIIGAVLGMSQVHAFIYVERESRWNPEILYKLSKFFGKERFIKSLIIIHCHSDDTFITQKEKIHDFLLGKIKSDENLCKLDSAQLIQWDNKLFRKEELKKHHPLMTAQIELLFKLVAGGVIVKPYVEQDLTEALKEQKLAPKIEKKATSAENWLSWVALPIVSLFAPILTLPIAFVALSKLRSVARSSRHLKSTDLVYGKPLPQKFMSQGDRIEKVRNPEFTWEKFEDEKIKSLIWLCYNRHNLFWCIVNLPKETTSIPSPCDQMECKGKIIIPFYGPPQSAEKLDTIQFVVSGISNTLPEEIFKKSINEALSEISKLVVESRIFKVSG